MDFKNQQEALQDLQKYAENNRQAILISGPEGCGKSYLAKQYGKLLGISDFQIVETKIANVRETMDSCYQITNPVVLCIENLDLGVSGVSYTLLKFIEEPKQNIYIVITCRNIRQIPDTIVSRCVTINVPPIIASDLTEYANAKFSEELKLVKLDPILWQCIKSVTDMRTLSKLTPEQISYFKEICGFICDNMSVTNIIWKLQYFPDKTPTPINIVVRYLMYSNSAWQRSCIDCLNTIAFGRLGVHAAMAKLVFELKYSG